MLHPTELAMQRMMTDRFIDADPVELLVTHSSEKVPDGAGGWTTTPGGSSVVRGRMIPQSDKVPVQHTSEGDRPAPEFVLLCLPEAPLRRYDTFEWRGSTWKVDKVHLKPDYELKGDVSPDGR